MNSIPYFLRPSWQSLSGQFLDQIACQPKLPIHYSDKEKILFKETYPSEKELQNQRVAVIVGRILAPLVLCIRAALDVAWWSVSTITLIPMFRLGLKNHLINLISTFALPILSLAIPFGYWPQAHHFRGFFPIGQRRDPDYRNFPHDAFLIHWYGLWKRDRTSMAVNRLATSPEFVSERLDLFPNTREQLAQEQANFPNVHNYHLFRPHLASRLNPNQQDTEGQTIFMCAAGLHDIRYANFVVSDLLAQFENVDSRLDQPLINLNLKDKYGFAVLSYALVGITKTKLVTGDLDARGEIQPERALFSVRDNQTSDAYPSDIMNLAKKFMVDGAFLPERDFEPYLTFTKELVEATNPGADNSRSINEIQTALENVRLKYADNRNQFIKLVVTVLIPKLPQYKRSYLFQTALKLQRNAFLLVNHKQEILDLSKKYDLSYIVPPLIREHIPLHDPNSQNPIADLVTSYL